VDITAGADFLGLYDKKKVNINMAAVPSDYGVAVNIFFCTEHRKSCYIVVCVMQYSEPFENCITQTIRHLCSGYNSWMHHPSNTK